jgi:hypothetical protein
MIIEDQRAELDDPVTGTRRALMQAQYHPDIAMTTIENLKTSISCTMILIGCGRIQ